MEVDYVQTENVVHGNCAARAPTWLRSCFWTELDLWKATGTQLLETTRSLLTSVCAFLWTVYKKRSLSLHCAKWSCLVMTMNKHSYTQSRFETRGYTSTCLNYGWWRPFCVQFKLDAKRNRNSSGIQHHEGNSQGIRRRFWLCSKHTISHSDHHFAVWISFQLLLHRCLRVSRSCCEMWLDCWRDCRTSMASWSAENFSGCRVLFSSFP